MAVSKTRRVIRLLGVGFLIGSLSWLFWNSRAQGFDRSILETDAAVNVSVSGDRIVFTPTITDKRTALIFYPGGMVDPRAYAPMARAVAEAGFPVFVLTLPFRVAPLASHRSALADRTRLLIERTGTVDRWVLAGHSRGGALVADVAADYAPLLHGIILIGTSHPRQRDLSGLTIEVTKIYATNDGLASESEVREYAGNLPPSTRWVRIEGGNHAQFGWYGTQIGDDRATISRREQQDATLAIILASLAGAERS